MFSVVIRIRVYKFAPIEVAAVERCNENLCRTDVCGNWDVVAVASADERVVAHGMLVILLCAFAEVDKGVYFVESDAACKLLCAALTAAGLTVTSIREKEDWRCVTAERRGQ